LYIYYCLSGEEYTLRKYLLAFLWIIPVLFFSCSAGKDTIDSKQPVKVPEKKEPNIKAAANKIIEGSLYEAKGDFANAILEYQEALSSDESSAIYFLLAKNYAELSKFSLAMENIRKAIALDSSNDEYRELLAALFISTWQIDSAITVYESLVKKDSSNTQALFNLAALYKKSKPLSAIQLYKKLINELGPNWDVLVGMIEIYSKLNKPKEELETLENLMELDPGNTQLKSMLAEFYFRMGEDEKSLEVHKDILEIEPGNSEVRTRLGFLYMRKNDFDGAEKIFYDIIKNDTVKILTKLDICSWIYFREESHEANSVAKKLFKQITITHPEDSRAFMYLSALYAKENNIDSAKKTLGEFIENERKNPVTNRASLFATEVGRVCLSGNDIENAIFFLEKTKDLYPNDLFLLFYLGFAYSRVGNSDASIPCLENALSLNPPKEIALDIINQLGMEYDRMKNYIKSDSLYEIGLNIDPDNHLILNNYSYSLSERNLRLEASEKMSKRALEFEPENSSYLDTYGWILFKLGRYNDAIKYITKALELRDAVGEDASVLNEHLGDIYFEIGDKEHALYYWEEALKVDPENKDVINKLKKAAGK
jgi:tetratricopeptide (TPR) repeat protein